MSRAIVMAAMLLAIAAPSLSHACTPSSQAEEATRQSRDVARFISIYEGRIADTAPGPYDHSWNFSLRATQTIWGETSPRELHLNFELGGCNNWFFLMDDDSDDDRPHDDQMVVVFATSEALSDPSQLYITRVDSPSSAYFFDRWRAIHADRTSQTEAQ